MTPWLALCARFTVTERARIPEQKKSRRAETRAFTRRKGPQCGYVRAFIDTPSTLPVCGFIGSCTRAHCSRCKS